MDKKNAEIMIARKKGRPKGSKNKVKKAIDHNILSLGKKHTDELMKLPKKELYLIVENALRNNYGMISQTAAELGTSRSTLNKIMKDEYWKEILLDIKEDIADRIETLFIKNSLETDDAKLAHLWARDLVVLSNTLKRRGWSKDPEIEINNNVSFTFKFNDGSDLDSPGQTIIE